MRKMCMKCCKFFEVGEEYVGYDVPCPHCGAEVHIPSPGETRRVAPRSNSVTPEPQVNTTLCFILGFCFNVLGLLIAAIIGKQKGCVCGLWGMLTADAICAGLWIAANIL